MRTAPRPASFRIRCMSQYPRRSGSQLYQPALRA
jgi:hypothetical protein